MIWSGTASVPGAKASPMPPTALTAMIRVTPDSRSAQMLAR
jgi:hypothetical protein